MAEILQTEPRVRYSIRWLEQLENRSKLDKVIRAFHGICNLPPTDENSFFVIGGYHGEPFAVTGDKYDWGGYCFHNAVLFPTWHRAYCMRIENALRTIPGCEDVTLPYWDELAEEGNPKPVPQIFTSPTYVLDNETIPNPLYSYKLQQDLHDPNEKLKNRYTKAAGYQTCRFPLSGLVGTEGDREKSKVWNSKFPDPSVPLNWNIRNYLNGEVYIPPQEDINATDTFSVIARIKRCLDAPNWTAFSNKASAAQYAIANEQDPKEHWVVSVEEPHNAIHLALGGLWLPFTGTKYPDGRKDKDGNKGIDFDDGYTANPDHFKDANGDMGNNETAAFDPIFFVHHAWIDYLMWGWQKKHGKTERGSLEINYWSSVGTKMKKGNAALPNGGKLEMTTPLVPFKKPDGKDYWTSEEVTNLEDLGYRYADGSLEIRGMVPRDRLAPETDQSPSFAGFESAEPALKDVKIAALPRVATIDAQDYSGSVIVRTFSKINGNQVEVGRDYVLGRYNKAACGNCQNSRKVNSFVPITKELAKVLDPDKTGTLALTTVVQTHSNQDPLGASLDGTAAFSAAPEAETFHYDLDD